MNKTLTPAPRTIRGLLLLALLGVGTQTIRAQQSMPTQSPVNEPGGVLTNSGAESSEPQRSTETVDDEAGNPTRIKHELIVRFNPSSVNSPAVDDTAKVSGTLGEFVSDGALKLLSIKIGKDLGQVPTFKIFRNFTTRDTVSIGRNGEPVPVPPLWSAFVLVLPDYLDDEGVRDMLNSAVGFVEYAHLLHHPTANNQPRHSPHIRPFFHQRTGQFASNNSLRRTGRFE